MLTAPVLMLNIERINEIDPRNVENLFGMWTVFSRCATTIQEGKRLENMSWRVWARETLCCPPQPERAIVPTIDVPPARSSGVPSLSSSVESDTSIDEKMSSISSRERCRKLSESQDSALSKSRGKEPHLDSYTLEKIVTNIQEKSKLEPLSPAIEAVVNAKMQNMIPSIQESQVLPNNRQMLLSTESSCTSTLTAATASTARQSDHRDSETSVSSADGEDGLIRSGSVVHGFSPATSSFRSSKLRMSQGLSTIASKNATKALAPARPMKFTLGGSSEEDESSFEARMSYRRSIPEKRTSSLSQSLSRDMCKQKKTTSFRDIVEQRRTQENTEDDEGAIASSDEDDDDDIIDSAIEEEDDEDGEWEDSTSDDGKAVEEKPVFKRIDSRPNLVSRRSVLTQGLTEGERAKGMMNAASKSHSAIHQARTSHNGPSMPGSPEDGEEDSGMMMQGLPGSKPLPIISTTSNTYAVAHSPRTTRQKMLATELGESLRKSILWERQQKNGNKNYLQRHAHSMANLPRAATAEEVNQGKNATRAPLLGPDLPAKNNNSWTFENPWEYHNKGW